jgi:hypothetical protein
MLLLALAVLAFPAWSQVEFNAEMAIPAGDFTSVVYDGTNLWLKEAGVPVLLAVEPVNGAKLFSVRLAVDGEYLAFNGRHLLLTNNVNKQIFVINPATGKAESYIDLKTIQGDRDMYVEPLRSGEIMGITCSEDRIWLGCGAGYSSSIYEIDGTRHIVLSHTFAPGPKPVSLAHHNGDLWVLDPDTQMLRCLKSGRQLVYELTVPVADKARAMCSVENRLFVLAAGKTNLRGVDKNKLSALVPEKIVQQSFEPYVNKSRNVVTRDERKIAVLISGDTAASGYNEFWSDVVLMYRILRARGYNELYVLYADGRDYSCAWSKYQETMTDFSASKANVVKIFNALANGDSSLNIVKTSADDTLFVFTFDHGASDGKLCLWQGERYSPSEMATAMRNIPCGKKYFYMQQCFSGAFKEEFKNTGLTDVAIVTAASKSQYAYRADTEVETYNSVKYYHGEFNWHFMSALMGKTPTEQTVNADSDNNGTVSVQESFDYYQRMNSQSQQTPQYHSNPTALGQGNTP